MHSYPSSVSPRGLARAHEVAVGAVHALGLRTGIAFPQLIVRDEDVRLIEIAARIGAGQMADLVRYATGVELFDVAILQSLGQAVPDDLIEPKQVRPIAIRFLTASPGVLPVGTVAEIEGLDRVRVSRGVLDAGLYFSAGATITPVQVDADRRGYVVATAETPEAALALADDAAGKLVVRTVRATRVSGNVRLLVPVGAAVLAAAAAALAVIAFHGGIRPRLVSETMRVRGVVLEVRYAFNEPVHALLLVNGKPATAASSLRRSGALVWHRRGHAAHYRIAIKGTDRSGRRAVVNL
jgi:hypothetical protein